MDDRTQLMSARALQPGYEILWYRIDEVLGQGGFGITYLAHDRNLDRPVAIKEYLPITFAYRHRDYTVKPLTGGHSEDFAWGLASFLKEAQTLARFGHHNIVRVHSVFEANNTAYMVMEYEHGDSLHAVYLHARASEQAFFENVFFPIFDGLQQIHELGFIHRDIKPSNIYIRANGTPVLLDFGSARQTSGAGTGEMTALVSHGYTPLEQYSANYGDQGPWTDIYALAATIFEGIVGQKPDEALGRSACRLRGRPDPVLPLSAEQYPGFTQRFLDAVYAALALEPEKRPATLPDWRTLFDTGQESEPLPEGERLDAGRADSPGQPGDRAAASGVLSDADVSAHSPDSSRLSDAHLDMDFDGDLESPDAKLTDHTEPSDSATRRPSRRTARARRSRRTPSHAASSSHPAPTSHAAPPSQAAPRRTSPFDEDVSNRLESGDGSRASRPRRTHGVPDAVPVRPSVPQFTSRTARTHRNRPAKRRSSILPGALLLLAVAVGGGSGWYWYSQLRGTAPTTLDAASLARLPVPSQAVEMQLPRERINARLEESIRLATAYRDAWSIDNRNATVDAGIDRLVSELRDVAQRWHVSRYPGIAARVQRVAAALPDGAQRQGEIARIIDTGAERVSVEDITTLIDAGQIVTPAGYSVLDRAPSLSQRDFEAARATPAWRTMMQSFRTAAIEQLNNREFDGTARLVEAVLTIEPDNPEFVRVRAHLLRKR